MKRVDPSGRTIGEILQNEISKNAKVEFYFELPQELEPRTSPLVLRGPVGILKSLIPLDTHSRHSRLSIKSLAVTIRVKLMQSYTISPFFRARAGLRSQGHY